MMTVSAENLVTAIREADAFKLPDMNEGTAYLYNSVYDKLSRNMEVKLSDIDFDAFEPEDVASLSGLYSDIFEDNHCTANRIASVLRSSFPVVKAVAYV